MAPATTTEEKMLRIPGSLLRTGLLVWLLLTLFGCREKPEGPEDVFRRQFTLLQKRDFSALWELYSSAMKEAMATQQAHLLTLSDEQFKKQFSVDKASLADLETRAFFTRLFQTAPLPDHVRNPPAEVDVAMESPERARVSWADETKSCSQLLVRQEERWQIEKPALCRLEMPGTETTRTDGSPK